MTNIGLTTLISTKENSDKAKKESHAFKVIQKELHEMKSLCMKLKLKLRKEKKKKATAIGEIEYNPQRI